MNSVHFQSSIRNFSLFILIMLFSATGLQAQNLTVNVDASTASNGITDFTIGDNTLQLGTPDELQSPSSDLSLKAEHTLNQVRILDQSGNELLTLDKQLDNEDGSTRIYAMNNGSFIIREVISNFDVYNSFGQLEYSIKNNTNSPGGESVSELAADPAGRTLVVYNPKIVISGRNESRASLVTAEGNRKEFFYSNDTAILDVQVSQDGNYISVIAEDNTVHLYDRFGNKLNEVAFNQDIIGSRFSDNGRYVCIYSTGRAGVYSVISGEREGSTSFRATVRLARYFPEDNTILAITGERNGNTLSGIEFHAINVSARSIARSDFEGVLGISDQIPLYFSRSGAGRYSLTGLNKKLNLRASF
jgi:WD40 repeat protein